MIGIPAKILLQMGSQKADLRDPDTLFWPQKRTLPSVKTEGFYGTTEHMKNADRHLTPIYKT